MTDWQWSYELTLSEMYGHHNVVPVYAQQPVLPGLEGRPFPGVPSKPLGVLSYQAAICSTPNPGSVWERMVLDGLGPVERSGDRRSGVILLKDDRPVGCYIDPGLGEPIEFILHVDPTMRGQGLGAALMVAWWLEFPRHRTLHPHLSFNQHAARTLTSAFKQYIEVSVARGAGVPLHVLESLEHTKAEIGTQIANFD